jgi:hypothetical protein
MINNAYHRKIAKEAQKLNQKAIENEKQNGQYEQLPKDMTPVATLSKLTGYEKEYVKQVPVVLGSGKPNMEMESEVKQLKRRGRKPKAPVLSMIYQQQMTDFKGGSANVDSESSESDREIIERKMGSGTVPADIVKTDAEKNYQKNLLAGSKESRKEEKKTKVPEVVEGSVIVESVVDQPKPKRGRKPKAPPVEEKVKSPVKSPVLPIMKRRANKVKELMKSKGLTMIAASKYIKENKVNY